MAQDYMRLTERLLHLHLSLCVIRLAVFVLSGLGNYLYIEASPETQGQKARLFSPSVDPDTGPLCLMFSYQLEDQGTLRVLLQNKYQEETLLWSLRGDQEPIWKEGRTIIPRSPNEFQVCRLDEIYGKM